VLFKVYPTPPSYNAGMPMRLACISFCLSTLFFVMVIRSCSILVSMVCFVSPDSLQNLFVSFLAALNYSCFRSVPGISVADIVM
jgi:hypothetical protein